MPAEEAAEVAAAPVIAVLHMKNSEESEVRVEEVLQEEAVVPDNCSLIEVEAEDEVGIEAVVVECTVVAVLVVGIAVVELVVDIAVVVLAERFEVEALAARTDIQG